LEPGTEDQEQRTENKEQRTRNKTTDDGQQATGRPITLGVEVVEGVPSEGVEEIQSLAAPARLNTRRYG